MPTPVLRDASTGLNPGVVSYNGFIFPPGIKSTAEYSPVYDDSNRIMKYMKVTLSIDTYIFYGCLTRAANVLGYTASTSQGSASYTSDSSMEEVRQRLCEPGQKLSFSYQGSGYITLQDPAGGSRDVNNGPKPKLVSWKPLGNKMAHIIWECEAWFSPCDDVSGKHRNPKGIAQFPYSVNFSIDARGFNTRTISGCIEISMSRLATSEKYAGGSRNFDTEILRKEVVKLFPIPPYHQRVQNYSLSQDRKTYSFEIVDTEVESEEAFGPGCANEQVRLTASASLNGGGFHKWMVSLSGQIELLAGYPKAYAYAEMMRLFSIYYVLNGTKGEQADDRKGVTGNSDQTTPSTGSGKKSVVILQSVKLSDNLFAKDISFDFTWGLFTTPSTLFKATGLFQPMVLSQSDQDKMWADWTTKLGLFLNVGGYHPFKMDQNDDLVVSLCQPMIKRSPTPPPKPEKPKKPKKEKPFKIEGSPSSTDIETEKNLYSTVDCRFQIERSTNTVRHVPLKSSTPIIPTVDPNKPKDPGINWGAESSSNNNHTILHHKTSPTSYVLIFKGHAVRLGHPVPIPEVRSYGGVTLTKIGEDIILPRKLGVGVDVATGNDYSINELIWEQRYSLPLPPRNSNIESDGHPWLYSSGPGGNLA